MSSSSTWIPFEWPSSWKDPALLKYLDAGPVNCILFPGNAPPDLRAAAERKFACPTDIAWQKSAEVDWRKPGDLAAIGDAVWPELALKQQNGGDAQAGPTGTPWLDANGWLIQMARGLAPAKTVWIRSDPPENAAHLAPDNYILANSEACAYGARRPLWLAAPHADSIARGIGAGVAGWDRILKSARWHEAHRSWAQYPVFARLLVISDFAGANQFHAAEVLNLSARRNLSFRIAEPSRFVPAMLAGMKAVLYVDAQPMPAPLAAEMQRFVESGGLLLCMKGPGAALRNARPAKETHPRFDLFDCGKGRLAVSKAEWEDQYILAQDTHLMMSRRYDAVRLFNAGSLTLYHTASTDRKTWLVHLLNYARTGPAHQVSLQTWQKISAARFHSFEGEAKTLELHQDTGQYEVHLPSFAFYGAVELELTNNA